MNFYHKLSILILMFCASVLHAQKHDLDRVTIAELEQKIHPKDSSAVAAILFKKGSVNYTYTAEKGFQIKTEMKFKIKIYTKEGLRWATNSIPYRANESLNVYDAVTYNLVDGKIEKTKLKSDGVFTLQIDKFLNSKRITFPNAKEGSIVEFSIIVISPLQTELKDWVFQHDIPVDYAEFKTYVPEYFVYKPTLKGFVFPKISVLETRRSIKYVYTEKVADRSSGFSERTNEELNYRETQTTYILENVPALKNERFVNNIDNYTAALNLELESINFPNQPSKNYRRIQ